MNTLTYGLKEPQTGDRGAIWFPALAANMVRLDAHDHDGTDSKPLTSAAITSVTGAVSAASWAAVTNKLGLFKQTVVMPAGYLYATKMISFRDTSGDSLFLQTEASATSTGSFTVYCNSSSLDVLAYYGI